MVRRWVRWTWVAVLVAVSVTAMPGAVGLGEAPPVRSTVRCLLPDGTLGLDCPAVNDPVRGQVRMPLSVGVVQDRTRGAVRVRAERLPGCWPLGWGSDGPEPTMADRIALVATRGVACPI
jgi:hypothetical protein